MQLEHPSNHQCIYDTDLTYVRPASDFQLEHLNLGGTRGIGGSLPVDYSSLTSLTLLNVSGAGLSGSLPTEWGSELGSLRSLDLSNNSIDGSLPAAEWAAMTSLTLLNISSNPLTGVKLGTDLILIVTSFGSSSPQ